MFALTVTGGAALAAVLAVRHYAGRPQAVQHKADLHTADLHTWESEGGSPVPPAVVQSRPQANTL